MKQNSKAALTGIFAFLAAEKEAGAQAGLDKLNEAFAAKE